MCDQLSLGSKGIIFLRMCGDIRKENVGVFVKIHATVVVLQAIGQHEIIGIQGEVIPRDLVEGPLCDLYLWGFAFYDDVGFQVAVEYDDVCALVQGIDRKLFFDVHPRQGIIFDEVQIMYGMLSHPFFRGEFDVFFAYNIPYIRMIFLIFDAKIKIREI